MQLVGLGNTRILTNSAQKSSRTLKGETIYCLHLIQYSQEINSQRRQPAKTFFFFRSKLYSNTRFAAVQSSWFKKVTKFHTWIQTATPTDCTFQIHVRDSNDKFTGSFWDIPAWEKRWFFTLWICCHFGTIPSFGREFLHFSHAQEGINRPRES